MQVIEGGINAAGKKFAIIVSRFNHFVVESLLDGAVQTLKHYGEVADDDITVVRVPGAQVSAIAGWVVLQPNLDCR